MRRLLPLGALVLLAGCAGIQSSNGRDGTHGALIGGLFDKFLWTTVVVYLFVMVLLALAIVHGRDNRRGNAGLQGEPPVEAEHGWRSGLTAFAGATTLILAVLAIATWFTDRSLARASANPALEVEVTGNQWWWDVRYKDPVSSYIVHTANELHLPAGRTTRITLKSVDVIHSLWIPNLAGKQDLIPGRKTALELHPLHTGRFRAQCAEFCGMQHAHMALDVSVDDPQAFSTWYAAGLKNPPIPTGGQALAGYLLFQTLQCSSCHNVSGTPASGQIAPDLTHVASRRTIASGTLPANHDGFAAWVQDPQQAKPGNHMPKVPLSPAELAAVTAYLETLR
ncbi:MAG: c-type cytochrome [Novosphingobium sp.]|nr:c-type cytochrome [Novosphingobium sp.]